MTSLHSFSLLTEPWIRCQSTDGDIHEVSIRDVFSDSRNLRIIRGESPAQDYAITRLLLAILWRAHARNRSRGAGTAFEYVGWFETQWNLAKSGHADDVVLDYLAGFDERFDLLDAKAPFMQVADLHTSKNVHSPLLRMIPEAENDYFTMRAGGGRESISLAEAARWLIYLQAYDYSGIKSGAVGDSRVKGGKGYPIGTGWTGMTGGTLIIGPSLRHTLLLNTIADAITADGDSVPWERTPDGPAERPHPQPSGPADLATWQSRRVRLFCEGDRVTGVLVSNGDQIPDAGANVWGDPMTPYRYSKNKSKTDRPVFYPKPWDTSRTMWRSLEPLMIVEGDPGTVEGQTAKRPQNIDQVAKLSSELRGENVFDWLDIQLVAVEYGTNSSVLETTLSTQLDVPVDLLKEGARAERRALLGTAQATNDAASALGSFCGQLLVAAGGEYSFQPAPTDMLLARLEPEFKQWLKDFDAERFSDLCRQWQLKVRREVTREARIALEGAGPRALVGRPLSQGDDESPSRIQSAGTAYAWLQHKLNEVLPRTHIPKEGNNA